MVICMQCVDVKCYPCRDIFFPSELSAVMRYYGIFGESIKTIVTCLRLKGFFIPESVDLFVAGDDPMSVKFDKILGKIWEQWEQVRTVRDRLFTDLGVDHVVVHPDHAAAFLFIEKLLGFHGDSFSMDSFFADDASEAVIKLRRHGIMVTTAFGVMDLFNQLKTILPNGAVQDINVITTDRLKKAIDKKLHVRRSNADFKPPRLTPPIKSKMQTLITFS